MFMEVPHKGGYGIVNYNPQVPKRDTFYLTDGSPQLKIKDDDFKKTILIYTHHRLNDVRTELYVVVFCRPSLQSFFKY